MSLFQTVKAGVRPRVVTWEAPHFWVDTEEQPGLGNGTSSPNGSAYTLLYGKLLHPTTQHGGLESPTFKTAIAHQPAAGYRIAGYATGLRGFVFKGADTRLTVTLTIQGVARVLNYPYGAVVNKDLFLQIPATNPQPDPKKPHQYTASVSIRAQARNGKPAEFLFQIDSLDIVPRVMKLAP